ncbi:unnamed protein product, partial [Prorocentrum cordatum]
RSGGYPSSSSSSSSAPVAAPLAAAGRSQGAARLLADDAARRRAGSQEVSGGALAAGGRSGSGGTDVDKAYDDIDNLLTGLKEKGQVINRTLDHHNEMLPGITKKVERDQERLRKQQDTRR